MTDLNELALPELFEELTGDGSLERLLKLARDEDLGHLGDVTTESIIDPDAQADAAVVARAGGVVAGLAAGDVLAEAFGGDTRFDAVADDGDACEPGRTIGRLSGDLRSALTVERTLLNLLGRLSGIATLTRAYVDAVAGTSASICDTRKTTPGLRTLEKYAVRCGGGTLHRIGLGDAALYKDNHLAHLSPATLPSALREAIGLLPRGGLSFVEVEVDTLDQLDAIFTLDAALIDIVLLDNMGVEDLAAAVAKRNAARPELKLEASGGVTLETVRSIAATGVDRISVGALTHSVSSLDLSLEVSPEPPR